MYHFFINTSVLQNIKQRMSHKHTRITYTRGLSSKGRVGVGRSSLKGVSGENFKRTKQSRQADSRHL